MIPYAKAECQTTLEKCDKALSACDSALEARNKEIKICNLALMQAVNKAETLNIQVKERESELSAWYRNPFIMITLGIVAGAIINSATNK